MKKRKIQPRYAGHQGKFKLECSPYNLVISEPQIAPRSDPVDSQSNVSLIRRHSHD